MGRARRQSRHNREVTNTAGERARRWITRGIGAYLLLVEPVRFAVVASAALSRVLDHGVLAIALLVFRVVVTGVGLTGGRFLLLRDDPTLARLFLALNALAVTLTFSTPYFPSNRVPGTKLTEWLLLMAAHAAAAWWLSRDIDLPGEASRQHLPVRR